jgi:hypothetical protein
MKRVFGDFIWAVLLLIWIAILVVPVTRNEFLALTTAHPYFGGFIKFFILASMGDMLGGRIVNGEWKIPQGFIFKAFVWGVLGMMITLVFTVYFTGAKAAMDSGKLPFVGSNLALAFFGSFIMNTTFGPMMYIYHKFGDMLVDLFIEKQNGKLKEAISVETMVNRIDWQTMVGFSWIKSCLLIWVPCHTIVFLLPMEYRVLASAFLSILLGILVAVSKKGSKKLV